MKFSTTVASLAVFCLLALQVQPIAQELQKHGVASLINDRDEIVGFSETSAPKPLVATTVKLYPTQLSFGYVTIGATSSKTVTLTNVGTSSLSIYGFAITGINSGDFTQTHTCSIQLARDASCSITVKFKPVYTGTRTAALSIRDNSAGSPQIIPLVGTGVAVCSSCLIRLCLVGSGNRLTGYCLEGARGGICHESYSPTQCPAGATAVRPASRQCGPPSSTFVVDAARPCL